jgi:hypothetical protein
MAVWIVPPVIVPLLLLIIVVAVAILHAKLKYLVSGSHEGVSEYLGRVMAGAALRKAKQLVQGYIDVSRPPGLSGSI